MRYIIVVAFIFLLCVSLCGCCILSHMNELIVLKRFAAGQEEISTLIQQQEQAFSRVIEAVKSGQMGMYKDKDSIMKTFGHPVFSRTKIKDGTPCEVWLYRHPIKYFNSAKVYIFFNKNGKLKEWKYVP